jgi:hypothetical protein
MTSELEGTYYVIGRFDNRTPDNTEPRKKEYISVPMDALRAALLDYISIHDTQAGRPVMGGKVTGLRKITEEEARETVYEGNYDDPERRIGEVLRGTGT